MSSRLPKRTIKPPTKAQSELINKSMTEETRSKDNASKKISKCADLLSESEDSATEAAPPKKSQSITQTKSLTQARMIRELKRRTELSSTVQKSWTTSNIDKVTTSTRNARPKGKINEKTLEREQDATAHWEERSLGKLKKYSKNRTSLGVDGVKVQNRPVVRPEANSGFMNPDEVFGDINTDLEGKIKTTKAKPTRFDDPAERFGGLQNDLESKLRKTRSSDRKNQNVIAGNALKGVDSKERTTKGARWKDPSSMFGGVEGTPKRKRDKNKVGNDELSEESSSSLSDCPSDLSTDSRPFKQLKKNPKKTPKKEEKPECPICQKELSPEFYKSWGSTAYLKLQKQVEIHAAHEKSDMEKEAIANNYPAIDVNWDSLQKRSAKHMTYLKELVGGKHESSFRKAMRSRKKNDFHHVTPGYYGPRGARVLMDEILRVMGDDILKAGQRDREIAIGGITAFAQFVLVPELGIRLIMEDLKIDSEEAAKIMSKTVKMGELLNDDEDNLLEDEDEGEGWMAV